jgi:ABC-type thiamin/hydroxymethylpyrimidine transport system permease subunit
MNPKEDLQHLLPENARDELIVLPRKSLQLSTISISTLTLGLGTAIGTLAMGSTLGGIAMGLCFIVSRVLGSLINKHEAALLSRFESGPSSPQR